MTSRPGPKPRVIVVMGVSGSGKTTTAALLAGRLHCEFADADDFHPPANVAKMRTGTPLTDEDRWPWIHAISLWIHDHIENSRDGVIACSALKRAYRDVLIGGSEGIRLVYLTGDLELILRRLSARLGHFMPPSLLESQFEALQVPGPDENPLVVSIDATPAAIVDSIIDRLQPP